MDLGDRTPTHPYVLAQLMLTIAGGILIAFLVIIFWRFFVVLLVIAFWLAVIAFLAIMFAALLGG